VRGSCPLSAPRSASAQNISATRDGQQVPPLRLKPSVGMTHQGSVNSSVGMTNHGSVNSSVGMTSLEVVSCGATREGWIASRKPSLSGVQF